LGKEVDGKKVTDKDKAYLDKINYILKIACVMDVLKP
jgi:hypothetical protein